MFFQANNICNFKIFFFRRNAGTAQVIVSVGGEDDKVVLRSVEYWDPCTNVWKQLAALPFAVR